MKRPSLISQGSLTRIFGEVNESWKRCDFQTAIEQMERARRLNPSNLDILVNLGRLHGLRYDYRAAELCFEQALRIAPNKSELLCVAGQQCRDFNNFPLAERYLKSASEQKNATSATLIKLAEVYERLRRSEAAGDLVDRALKSDPGFAPALLLRAKLERQAGRLDEAAQRLWTFPASAEPNLRASALYEFGAILDRQGQYDQAMEAFLQAKALLQSQAARPAAELKVMRTRINHLTANASMEVLKKWVDDSALLQPVHRMALLGGHPRSGTTLLEQVLDSHPGMVSAEETEIFYNDAYGPLLWGHPEDLAMYDALAAAKPNALQTARQNYFRAMELSLGQPIAGRLLIDKNPSYTFLIPALVRIFPEMKYLITLRDPRDVVLSCFMQNLPLNQVGAACLTLASTAAEYVELMGGWRTLAPKLPVPYLEVRYEDMVENLESVARKTLEFLGVSWDDKVLGFDAHARAKMVRSPTYADVTQPVYKRARGRWRNYQKYLDPHLAKLEPFVKALGYE